MGAKLVGLVRVSTDKQRESGLGLEAQTAAIDQLRINTNGNLISTYVETESGMHDDIESRPKLRAAVAHAKRAGATLVIAKIDRLVRSTVVMAYLKTSGVKFVACDNPYANELTIDILVAVAADEGRRISQRTKDALKAYREGKASPSEPSCSTPTACPMTSSKRPPVSLSVASPMPQPDRCRTGQGACSIGRHKEGRGRECVCRLGPLHDGAADRGSFPTCHRRTPQRRWTIDPPRFDLVTDASQGLLDRATRPT